MEEKDIRRANLGIAPVILPNDKEYRAAIVELEWAETDFLNVKWLIRLQVREAVAAIGNALDIFLAGFPDAACYCLRQAIELSTSFVYLNELPPDKKEEKIKAWANVYDSFPMRWKMDVELREFGGDYAEMRGRMPNFFNKIKETNIRLNKYVHKQGYEFLYNHRRLLPKSKREELLRDQVDEYGKLVEDVIGIVALFKLACDPMPLILGDERLANRVPGLIVMPYSKEFTQKYLGEEVVSEFKATKLYKTFEDDILCRPENNEAIYQIKQDCYVQRDQVDEILKQVSHLDFKERIAVIAVFFSTKVACVHFCDGLTTYFSDVHSNAKHKDSFCNLEFKQLRETGRKLNIPYNGVYMSLFDVYDGDMCFVEHNTPFSNEEFLMLCKEMAQLNIGALRYQQEFEKAFH